MTDPTLLAESHNDRDGPKLSPIPLTDVIEPLNDVSTHTITLLFFLPFNVFGMIHNRPVKIIVD